MMVCPSEKETDGLQEVRERNVVQLHNSAIFQAVFFNGISFVQLLATVLSKHFMIIWQIIGRLRTVE